MKKGGNVKRRNDLIGKVGNASAIIEWVDSWFKLEGYIYSFLMRNFLIPLLAAVAFPNVVNATNYIECEAIANALDRFTKGKGVYMYMSEENKNKADRLKKDAEKRNCFYLNWTLKEELNFIENETLTTWTANSK